MAKTSREIEQDFINGLKTETGKDLHYWLSCIKENGIVERNDQISWLKVKHGFGHMHANLLMGIYSNNGNLVYSSEQTLLDNQFDHYQDMRPLFENLQNAIIEWDDTIDFVVKKSYVSITKKREFAAINIKKGELRLGLDLGEKPFNHYIEKAKLTGPMSRISHMVIIRDSSALKKDLFYLLEIAKNRVTK
jgi:predicted transport protein